MEAVRISRIEADQGPVLRDLRLRSLADAPVAFGQPLDEARARSAQEWQRNARRSATGDGRTWLLAYLGDRSVGLVQGRRRRPTTLLLFSMWVDPEARRSGIGRALVDDLERWAIAWGADETVLWVIGHNAPAIAFYARLGFRVLESGPDADSGARFGALAMHRTIPSAPSRA